MKEVIEAPGISLENLYAFTKFLKSIKKHFGPAKKGSIEEEESILENELGKLMLPLEFHPYALREITGIELPDTQISIAISPSGDDLEVKSLIISNKMEIREGKSRKEDLIRAEMLKDWGFHTDPVLLTENPKFSYYKTYSGFRKTDIDRVKTACSFVNLAFNIYNSLQHGLKRRL